VKAEQYHGSKPKVSKQRLFYADIKLFSRSTFSSFVPIKKRRKWNCLYSQTMFSTIRLHSKAGTKMIAFITISSLVPLIEGLCSSDSISVCVLGFTTTSFTLLFRKKNILRR